MFDRIDAKALDDLTKPLGERAPGGVYFARVCGWNEDVKRGVWAFHEAATQRGVVLEGQIANPDERQLGYLRDVLGDAFRPDPTFIVEALKRWTPRLSPQNQQSYAEALCKQFDELRSRGKNESILRNIYMKLMCWLYYRFERLMPFLGGDEPPKVLYCTDGVTAHELILLRLLNGMGADILLLEPRGDAAYLKQDPQSAHSQLLIPEGQPFPKDFSLKGLRAEMASKPQPRPAVDPMRYFKAPQRAACTNAWMKAADYDELLTPPIRRGDDLGSFYNGFIRVKGVRDKVTYLSELHRFYRRITETGRRVVIVEGGIPMPNQDEIGRIRRHPYRTPEELIVDLAGNLPASASVELQRQAQRAFVETMQRAAREEGSLSRLLNSAVYLLCWIQRYQGPLFQGYRDGDIPCFILLGGCQSVHEALYMAFLSRMPVDVLIFNPDLDHPCMLKDDRLLELSGENSMKVDSYPRDATALQARTLAADAEDDLTHTLYADSGIYRARQFTRAEALTLQTTYDELFLLWGEELKYRSGFAANGELATMPVLYAKISGVERGNAQAYWYKIKELLDRDGDAWYLDHLPIIPANSPNPHQSMALKVVRNGKLMREALKRHPNYPFAMLREALQEHMLDKLELMLERRFIRGTFENGMEYTVVATVLNLDRAVLRQLQSFDFAQRNPKLILVTADDRPASPEDAILLTFLNLVGFDILMFVPTGYQTIERHLNGNLPVEHQAGTFMYDLTVPDIPHLPPQRRSWLDSLLGRK